MAWQRTALGLAGVSALLLHPSQGELVQALLGILGMVLAIGLILVQG